ncbi:MAG: DsrE family protein [Gammaproteobacteria bacterium]|jgi:predicted peroxiredoxin
MNTATSNVVSLEPAAKESSDAPLVILLTSGPDDGGKRATLAYTAACTSLGMEKRTRIFLVGDGAFWGYEGHAAGIHMNGFPALDELTGMFRDLGGETYICSTCDQVCGIPSDGEPGNRVRRREVHPCGMASILPEITRGSSITF